MLHGSSTSHQRPPRGMATSAAPYIATVYHQSPPTMTPCNSCTGSNSNVPSHHQAAVTLPLAASTLAIHTFKFQPHAHAQAHTTPHAHAATEAQEWPKTRWRSYTMGEPPACCLGIFAPQQSPRTSCLRKKTKPAACGATSQPQSALARLATISPWRYSRSTAAWAPRRQ